MQEQTAVVQPQSEPKKKYYAQLRWRDWTSSLEELIALKRMSKCIGDAGLNQNLEIFFYGCDSISTNKEIEDKVSNMDAILENLRPLIAHKPRYLEKTCNY
jgi:hypothetical protein